MPKKLVDHVLGAESDSTLRLHFQCPRCGLVHPVALTKLEGRFSLECGNAIMTGTVANWATYKAQNQTCLTSNLQ